MTAFENYIHQHFNMNPTDAITIAGSFKPEIIKKGDYFLRAGEISNRLSFMEDGLLRIFVDLPDREVTQWISTRESFVTDFNSFFYRQPSLRAIQALADTPLLSIDYEQYHRLGKSMSVWNEFEKIFIGKCFVYMESRVFDLISLNAEERYQRLFEYNSELFNQVPLQYIASMLGMTRETFSRIRRKRQVR